MMRFKLDEVADQMPTLHGQLSRRKRVSPPGKWRPFFKLAYVTFQDEETDKWVGWVRWTLFDSTGQFPCRDAGKNESISRADPPDYWPTQAAASQFAAECVIAIRAQYNEWIQQDFSNKEQQL
jgi:hypothetical protein